MQTPIGTIMQLGYVVDNLEQAVEQWHARTGVGPFYMMDAIGMDNYRYRGVSMPVEMRLAFGYWGSVQVEFIQPIGDGETFYHHALRDGANQLNHYATIVDNIETLLDERALHDKVIHEAVMPSGLRFVYLEHYFPGGQHLELIEAQPSTVQAFGAMQAIAANWNGERPLRPMSDVAGDIQALASHSD